jgi:myo-inositol-1(or 4)-monophosphatase
VNYGNILQTATAIAREAGAVVRDRFPRTRLTHIGFKGAVNPVTETDIAVEALIVAHLRAAFPGHRFLGEEGGGDEWRAPGSPIWLIDPLDGTNNFAHGFPPVGVSLALLADGQPVVGVIHDPLRGETFAATAGGGATLDGQPIQVSSVGQLADAFLATGFPYDRRTAPDNNVERLDHFLRRSLGVRRAGAAVLDQAYVACGRLDGFWEIRLKPWDVAAGVLLVREAGGRATDFEGGPDCLSGEFIVASNGRIHDDMLRVIREGASAPRPEPAEGPRSEPVEEPRPEPVEEPRLGHRDDCIEI